MYKNEELMIGRKDAIFLIIFVLLVILIWLPEFPHINEGYTIAKIYGRKAPHNPYYISTDKGEFNTNSEVFNYIEEGKTYRLHHYGFRYGYGIYPKVVDATIITDNS